ncbi:ParA family protein [Nocardioides ginsengisoli]|uniref:ParA family protein n=1 Tax=Streptomyces plumbiresistens TaxID=511811 RepID=A0ABP7U0V2_9ACTN
MSRILAVGCPKGGVGKTTSAVTLAAIAAKHLGLKTLVVDGDKNKSTVNWYSESEDQNMPFDVAEGAEEGQIASLSKLRRSTNYDLTIVDLAGARTGGFQEILQGSHGIPGADFLLMPTQHGTMDLDALPPVIQKELPAGLPYLVALTMVSTEQLPTARYIQAQLREDYGWSVAETIIRRYAVYGEARDRFRTVLDMPGKHSYARTAEAEYKALAVEVFGHLDIDTTALEQENQP